MIIYRMAHLLNSDIFLVKLGKSQKIISLEKILNLIDKTIHLEE